MPANTTTTVEGGAHDSNKSRKRSNNDDGLHYSFVKRRMNGIKLIKIEIYDVETLKKSQESNSSSVCNCKAEVCVQHCVQSLIFDDIYSNIKELVSKIENSLLNI